MVKLRWASFVVVAGALTAAGCAGNRVAASDGMATAPQVERGQPRPVVDGVGWVLGIPEKVLLWDRRAENHDVSPETEQSVARYMAANGNTSTKVRINEYAPGDEWRRLASNRSVGAGWRYTFGALRTLRYTVFPGRLIGNDGYNPYTDTVSIYSDIPALAMEQAGHAKIIHGQSQPGTYATVFSLPVLSLFPEKRAKDDVLSYITWEGGPDAEATGMRTLYPQYGTEVGGVVGDIVPGVAPLAMAAGAGVGHAVGWFQRRGLQHDAEALAAAKPAAGAPAVAMPAVARANVFRPAINPADGLVIPASANEPVIAR